MYIIGSEATYIIGSEATYIIGSEATSGFIHVGEILFFSRSGNCQGILRCAREKYNFAKMSGNLHFSLMKLGCLVLLYSSC